MHMANDEQARAREIAPFVPLQHFIENGGQNALTPAAPLVMTQTSACWVPVSVDEDDDNRDTRT